MTRYTEHATVAYQVDVYLSSDCLYVWFKDPNGEVYTVPVHGHEFTPETWDNTVAKIKEVYLDADVEIKQCWSYD